MWNKCYSELIGLLSFEERLSYLQEGQCVSDITLGGHRWLCQEFYRSKEWKHLRDKIIARDLGRDLAVEGYDIFGEVIIHHISPLRIEDYLNRFDFLYEILNKEKIEQGSLEKYIAGTSNKKGTEKPLSTNKHKYILFY